MRPAQVVLLVRGVLKGESAAALARELGTSRTTITELRRLIQANAQHIQPEQALTDHVVEADEMFQNAGGGSDEHFDPLDPPRRRANKRRGRGTYANDRPPVLDRARDGPGALARGTQYESRNPLFVCRAVHPTGGAGLHR